MAHRGNVSPNVLQRDPLRIHRISMTAIILDLLTAMPAKLDWRSNPAECSCPSLCVVEKTVVTGMKATGYWKTGGYFDRYPMSKFHAQFAQVCPQQHVPFRKVIKKKRATRLQRANRLSDPPLAPFDIFFVRFQIDAVRAVFFAQIEWWISKDSIDDRVMDVWQHRQTVTSKKRPEA